MNVFDRIIDNVDEQPGLAVFLFYNKQNWNLKQCDYRFRSCGFNFRAKNLYYLQFTFLVKQVFCHFFKPFRVKLSNHLVFPKSDQFTWKNIKRPNWNRYSYHLKIYFGVFNWLFRSNRPMFTWFFSEKSGQDGRAKFSSGRLSPNINTPGS